MAYHQNADVLREGGRVAHKLEGMDGAGRERVAGNEAQKVLPDERRMEGGPDATYIQEALLP